MLEASDEGILRLQEDMKHFKKAKPRSPSKDEKTGEAPYTHPIELICCMQHPTCCMSFRANLEAFASVVCSNVCLTAIKAVIRPFPDYGASSDDGTSSGDQETDGLLRKEKGDEWADTRWLSQETERQRKDLNAICAISESTGLNSQDLVTDLNKTYKEQAFRDDGLLPSSDVKGSLYAIRSTGVEVQRQQYLPKQPTSVLSETVPEGPSR